MTEFMQHCVSGARRFLQTAVVIDNEASLDPRPRQTREAPRRAAKADTGILAGSLPVTTVGAGPAGPPTHEAPKAGGDSPTVKATPDNARTEETDKSLDAKALMDSFALGSVICTLYRPDPGDEMVEASTRVAQQADLVIIDWLLEGNNSVKARAIIKNILTQDVLEGGRLRLICVYTSEANLLQIVDEVLDAVEGIFPADRPLVKQADGPVLTNADTRICFYNKPTIPGSDGRFVVDEKDLPNRMVGEFAALTEGVLCTFAISSVAAIRRSTHHILSLFRKELDGAYVAHRCALDDPDEALGFATDLITGELSNAISLMDVANECMSPEILKKWIDHVETEKNQIFTDYRDARVTADVVKSFVDGGANVVDKSAEQQVKRADPATPLPKQGTSKITGNSVSSIFYASLADSWRFNAELARLAAFKREHGRRTKFPADWRPTLTLGSLLRLVRPVDPTPEDDAKDRRERPSEYILCVQPRCDAVRLESVTSFPFQTVVVSQKKFDLVVVGPDGKLNTLLVNSKPRDSINLRFKPDDTRTVRAIPGEDSTYIFEDDEQRRYEWVADIKDLKAQSDASRLAAELHRVGFDNFQWLHRGAKGDIKRPEA